MWLGRRGIRDEIEEKRGLDVGGFCGLLGLCDFFFDRVWEFREGLE